MNSAPIIPPGVTLPPMLTDAERQAKPADKHKPKRTRHTGDRFAVFNAFIDFTAGTLKRAEAMTWLVLYRDTRNGTARTAQADIARRIGSDTRTVKRAIRRLRAAGLVRIVWQGGFRKGPSVYAVLPTAKVSEKPP